MLFKQFAQLINERLQQLAATGKLFRSSVTGNQLWDIYINGFKPGDNPIFRDPASSSHNSNLDKSFIRRYGNIVAVDDNYNILSLWDVAVQGSVYEAPAGAMNKALTTAPIADIFLETLQELNSLPYEKVTKGQNSYRLGFPETHKIYTKEEAEKFGVVKAGEVYKFYNFYADLPKQYVDVSGKSEASILSEYKSSKDVFSRGMLEIPADTLELVKDLINQGSLLDGETHLYKIAAILPLKKEYDTIAINKRDVWCWIKSNGLAFAKFRNELIGTLCVELAEGVELNEACKTWNKRVDPANYMKAKAPITKKQIEEAKKFVQENGYEESFNRRFATIDDINIDEILHSNVGKEYKVASVFDKMQPAASTRHKRSSFDGVEEVSIEKFMKDILPTASSLELFFENRMEGNLVALTTAATKGSKPMFKWNNNFSWTFNGNLAGKSQIKEAVKSLGGNVDGILRFSLIWNESGSDNSDLDAWCKQPDGQQIGYSTGYRKDRGNKFTSLSGQLDLDNTGPGRKMGVENIYFLDKKKLIDGSYTFSVHQFSARNSQPFKMEIEVDGEIYSYSYDRPLRQDQRLHVATVSLHKGVFSVEHKLPETNSSKKAWNLDTNEFHKVSLVSLSPNHWGDNNVGNKHYLFMLDGCKSDIAIRSFHNENLNADLLAHKKVMEVLGSTTMLEPADKQLSGLGFNASVKDSLILRVSGSHKRVIKVNFA